MTQALDALTAEPDPVGDEGEPGTRRRTVTDRQ